MLNTDQHTGNIVFIYIAYDLIWIICMYLNLISILCVYFVLNQIHSSFGVFFCFSTSTLACPCCYIKTNTVASMSIRHKQLLSSIQNRQREITRQQFGMCNQDHSFGSFFSLLLILYVPCVQFIHSFYSFFLFHLFGCCFSFFILPSFLTFDNTFFWCISLFILYYFLFVFLFDCCCRFYLDIIHFSW